MASDKPATEGRDWLSAPKDLEGPSGGGWRAHGWEEVSRTRKRRVGYAYIHTAIDDRTRLVYSEVLHDEQGPIAATFWTRAATFFASQGVHVKRVITDNGLLLPLPSLSTGAARSG